MKGRLKQHLRKYGPYWGIVVLTISYLLLNWNRLFTLYSWADADDTMQYDLSKSLSEGEWLGPYGRATLIKGIVFPAWTALLHGLHIPLWLGTSILMILACLAIIYALRRLITNKWALTAIYGLLVLNPMVTERAYRDYIIPAITVLVCAWGIGLFATIIKAKEDRKITVRDGIIFTLIGVIVIPAWYYLREDGYWIMPFIGGLLTIAIITYLISIHRKVLKHLASIGAIALMVVLPFAATWVIGLGIGNMNEKYYGRNVVNDYFSSDFKDAYAALSRVNTEGQKYLTVPISTDMREQIYKVSPAFKELQACLDAPTQDGFCEGFKKNGVDASVIEDYQGGWFPFALRLAVDTEGYYATASKAEGYYTELAKQVNEACDTGVLSCHEPHIVSFLPTPDPEIVFTVFTSNSSSIASMVAYLQLLNRDGHSDLYVYKQPPTTESKALDKIANYYGVIYKTPAQYSTVGAIKTGAVEVIWNIYRILTPLLMWGTLFVLIVTTALYFKRIRLINWKILTLGWLLAVTIGIRLAMLAYVYTVDFPTDSNVYFAPVYSLLFLFEGIGLAITLSIIKAARSVRTLQKQRK